MSKLKIQTTQNVPLDFELAGVGNRVVIGLIDMAIVILYAYIAYEALGVLGVTLEETGAMQYVFYLVIMVPINFYYPVSEMLWKGQTVGKKVMKCRVIQVDGSRLTIGSLILRWLLRSVDTSISMLLLVLMGLGLEIPFVTVVIFFIIPFPLIGLISMGVTASEQRLGDLAANTTVVRMKRHVSLKDTILKVVGDDYQPVYLNVLKLSDRDIRIIKETLEDYERTRDATNVKILGKKAKEILEIKEKVKPLTFLRTIIRDYNALANR